MGAATTALIVDDERDIRELIAVSLERTGVDTHTAANLSEAYHLLDTYPFDVCLTDMRLPDGNGLELVRHVQAKHPTLPVAVITAHGNVEAAVEAMKDGAFDFVSKPIDIGRLRRMVAHAAERRHAAPAPKSPADPAGSPNANGDAETSPPSAAPLSAASLETLSGRRDELPRPATALVGADRLVGNSPLMEALRGTIAKVSRTNAPVWITGESGTGKELIARLIHDNGPRAGAPFVAINCGAIPGELMESELFGHVKGSFTGAVTNNDGLFRRAEGGTLFLDEVASLPLHMQVKLLRAVQERSVRPVGGQEEVPIDARILSASHEDLASAVDAGRFRHDLYYRLNVISIRSPSLRERPGDVTALARCILERLVQEGQPVPRLDEIALARLEAYHFPGNVRELENLIERAVALSEGERITAADLVLRVDGASRNASPSTGRAPERRLVGDGADRERLVSALDATNWNRKAAAAAIGLTYRQFRYRLAQLGINGPADR